MKTCKKCESEKPTDEFYSSRSSKDRLSHECKTCVKVRVSAWGKSNRDKTSSYIKNWRLAHREQNSATSKAWKIANRDRVNSRKRETYPLRREKRLFEYREWRKANPEKAAISCRNWYLENQDKAKANCKAWRKSNPSNVQASNSRYYKSNAKKCIEQSMQWRKDHPAVHAAKQAKRRFYKLNATPAWANDFFIKEAYDLASRRTKIFGFEWHVDHVVPLKSSAVCGLHVECNLQVIPGISNISKSNLRWPDMP